MLDAGGRKPALAKGLAAVAVIALALGVGGYFALRHRARQAGERFVARAVELEARRHERPRHAAGAPAESLAALLKKGSAKTGWTDACTAVAAGDEPLEKLDEACAKLWEADREWAVQVMETSRAESWSRAPDEATGAWLYATRLAALEVRRLPPAQAAALCVDALALGRDRAMGGGAIGMAVASSLVNSFHQVCAGAAAHQRPALEAIVRSWPAPGDWVPYEMFNLAGAFYPVLGAEQLARIPARLRAPVDDEPNLLEQVVLMHAFPGVVTMFERIEQAAALERSKRDAELAAIQAAEAGSWNPLRRAGAPDYSKFFARDDRARDQLQALVKGL